MAFVSVTVDPSGIRRIEKKLRGAQKIGGKLAEATADSTNELHSQIQGSSPVDTGEYRNNWQTKTQGLIGEITNNTEYANRLIHGFYGIDSQGRHYAQPILHDVEAIVAQYRPQYYKNIRQVVAEVLK